MILYSDPRIFLDRKSGKDLEKTEKFSSLDFSILEERGYKVAFLALDGEFGEDGHVQALLDLTPLAYTGSGVMASSIGMNKSKTYEYVSAAGLKAPEYFVVHKNNYDLAKLVPRIENECRFPCVVKPNDSGSSIGVALARSSKELGLALVEAFRHSPAVILQRFIRGREFACGVLGNAEDPQLQVLPVVESMVKDQEIFTHYQKYFANDTEEICPAKIAPKLRDKIMGDSELVHRVLGCDGLSRSDFRYDPQEDKLYFLEINTSPGHTENSICPQEARSIGITFGRFVLKQIDLAIQKKKYLSL